MDATNEPGPGRSTSDRAFGELTKEIARKNDEAHKTARKERDARDREKVARRRRDDDRV
jgi:hypothetical protein